MTGGGASTVSRRHPGEPRSRKGLLSPGFILENAFNLVFRRRLDFAFDRIPLCASGLPIRKIVNLGLIAVNRLLPFGPALGRPYIAHISPSGLCDLRCRLCPAHDETARGRTLLPFETFRKFIDEAGGSLIYIILWGWGEPLLNPDLPRMIAYARDRGILTITSSNLNRMTPEFARAIVASGLDALIVALDGAEEDTHNRLRPGASAARVIENIRTLLAERSRAGAAKPLVNLRMVVSRENEAEVELFRSLARSLGVDMVSFKAFSTRQPGYADPDFDRDFAAAEGRFRWYEYLPGYRPDPRKGRYACKFPWTKPTLFADGEVAVCEFDWHYDRTLGNIDRTSFKEIWFGSKARETRRRFLRNRDEFGFCRDCVYDYKTIPGCVVDWEDLRA